MRRKLVTAAKEEEEKPSFSREEKKTRNEAPFFCWRKTDRKWHPWDAKGCQREGTREELHGGMGNRLK